MRSDKIEEIIQRLCRRGCENPRAFSRYLAWKDAFIRAFSAEVRAVARDLRAEEVVS